MFSDQLTRKVKPRSITGRAKAAGMTELDYLKMLVARHGSAHAIAKALQVGTDTVINALMRNRFFFERDQQKLGKWVHRPFNVPQWDGAA